MEVVATQAFIKSAKAIAKKYRSFNTDYQKLVAIYPTIPIRAWI